MRDHARRRSVCIVRHDYYPDGHVSRDAEALHQAGYTVTVVVLRRPGEPARQVLNGVRVRRLPLEHRRGGAVRYAYEYLAFLALALVTVGLLHARQRFAVVEVDNMPDVLVFSALIPKLTGARVILYIFDNMPELLMVARGVGPRHPLVRLLAALERLSAAFADRVIVTQEPARRVVVARGTPAERVAVVLNCPDEGIFKPTAPRARPRDDGRFEIVTHGTVVERYGIQVAIDALPRVVAEVPDAHLHVFGHGEYRRALEARARRNGVAGHVTFHGLAPLDELLAHLARADVGYVGMLCDLMLSNKLMECVALGVPAVVARWPTYAHYFPDDSVTYFRAGSAAAAAEAILAVHRAPDEARARAERAAALYRRYCWSVQREVYLGVFAELLGLPAGHRVDVPSHPAY